MLTIPQQAGADGRLFGSVTAQDIATAIREARGLRIDKRNVHLPEPIKNVGTYMVVVEVVDGRDRDDQDDGRRQEVAPPAASARRSVGVAAARSESLAGRRCAIRPRRCEHVFVPDDFFRDSGEPAVGRTGSDLDSPQWP